MAHHRFFSDGRDISRRSMLRRCGTGFGALALADLMSQAGLLSVVPQGLFSGSPALASEAVNPMLPKAPPLAAKAKHVIHIFLNGGASQVDTFDPKPALAKYAGKSLPMENLKTERKTGRRSHRHISSRNTAKAVSRSARFFRTWGSVSTKLPSCGRCRPTCRITSHRCYS